MRRAKSAIQIFLNVRNGLLAAFQKAKPGSRPGPSTGSRPNPASQKPRNVQGQPRPKPAPPAKKSNVPGIVSEGDFEEEEDDDVICID